MYGNGCLLQMPIKNINMKIKSILKKAEKEKKAVGQFNFSDYSQLKGIIAAIQKTGYPAILGNSEKEADFIGLETAVALRDLFRKQNKISVFLNLDHGKSEFIVKKACRIGYDMVHFDGSSLSLKENIKRTKKIVRYARKYNVLVEGEVGVLGTESSKLYKEDFKIEEKNLTDPKEAEIFVKETGIDYLAVSIGNFHGMKIKGKNPKIQIERLKEIKKRIGNKFIVLHGGSGIPDSDIKKAIKEGIVKININTEIRKVFTEKLRETLNSNKEEIVPYKYFPPVINEVQKKVENKIKLFQ